MSFFVRDLGFPEAPVLLPDGSFLVTEMSPSTGCITWVARDGASRRQVAITGRPNGLVPDEDGFFWVAESKQKALLKIDLEGEIEIVAKARPGLPFLFMNDLAFAPNGDLYITDSGIEVEEFTPNNGLHPDWRNLHYDGRVYRVDTGSGFVETIDQGIQFANGIAFGPDQKLYVAETLTGNIYRYEWEDGLIVSDREVFGNVIDPSLPPAFRGPDGMKFGQDGNLYVAVFGQGDVTVLGRDGQVVNRWKTQGSMPTNLVFGAAGEQSIYVTEAETGSVQKLHVGTDGFPLYV